jgi:hypothetical protein
MLHDIEREIAELGGASQRELASYVCEEFREARAETNAALEQQLGKLSLSEMPVATSAEDLRVDVLRHRKGDETLMPTIAEGAASHRGSRRRRRVAGAMLLATFAAASGLMWCRTSRPVAHVESATKAAAASPPTPTPSPLPPEAPAPAPVRIDVNVTPATAQIVWDDRPLENPSTQILPRDDSRHVVRASAKGFATRTIEVVLDRDARIELSLERAPAAEPIGRPKPPPPLVPSVSPSRCDPPYHVDERGIRKMKPECM